jgi:hypothetical protein
VEPHDLILKRRQYSISAEVREAVREAHDPKRLISEQQNSLPRQ